MTRVTPFPVDVALPELLEHLHTRHSVILEAPPGAGKTTRVPPALLGAPWLRDQRIVMLEPRRLAARAAARFMAQQRGEPVGDTIGYRVRGDTRTSARTRIEVVTEGVLTRMLAADPTLEGIGAVIFDEFHERSLHADVGLALTLHVQTLLRDDLRIIVMSATLESSALAELLRDIHGSAPIVRSPGQSFPVEVRYVPPPPSNRPGVQTGHVAGVIADALEHTNGDMLVFLPGVREIRACAAHLHGVITPHAHFRDTLHIHKLHGTMELAGQDAAIAPAPVGHRKVVLATNIAETSLTIEGVRVVVDAGWSRQLRYDARIGLSRLETVRVTQASAEQRRGRAGRVAPGICYRLWDAHEHGSLLPRVRPEMLDADLAPLALTLADAGIDDAQGLRWLDAPSPAGIALSHSLLQLLGAMDEQRQITAHGRAVAALPMHPRLAHLVLRATTLDHAHRDTFGTLACTIAACVEERDVARGVQQAPPTDLSLRVEAVLAPHRASVLAQGHAMEIVHGALHTARDTAKDIARRCGIAWKDAAALQLVGETGALLALAYPDRLARRREGQPGRYLLVNGTGASLRDHDPLFGSEWLAVAELGGVAPEFSIVRAASLSHDRVLQQFRDVCHVDDDLWYDTSADRIKAEHRIMLGQVPIETRLNADISVEARIQVLLDALRQHGLQVIPAMARIEPLRQRLAFVHEHDGSWPDVSGNALLDHVETWLAPSLHDVRGFSALTEDRLASALLDLLTWQQRAALDELAPATIQVPSGSRITINYAAPAAPVLSVKLQEVFGWLDTPRVMRGRVPLTLHLLSPAQRPVQVTQDLARFWRDGYFEVRKELRGRYPKHPWPDNPLTAAPTRHTTRRASTGGA